MFASCSRVSVVETPVVLVEAAVLAPADRQTSIFAGLKRQ